MSEYTYYSQYNKAEFDEPFYAEKPARVLVIASTPRVGSTLLLRGLMSINAVATSTELFNPVHKTDFEARWGTLSDKDYLEKLIQYRTMPNGLFAVKTHYNHFINYEKYIKQYNRIFLSIQRKDIVRQAVSWFKGNLTQAWSSERIPQKKLTEANYNFDAICVKLEEINKLYTQWEEYYSVNGHIPYRIYYEDLDRNYNNTISDIASNCLNISVDTIQRPTLQKQRDELTEYYVSRFYADKKHIKPCDQVMRLGKVRTWMQRLFTHSRM